MNRYIHSWLANIRIYICRQSIVVHVQTQSGHLTQGTLHKAPYTRHHTDTRVSYEVRTRSLSSPSDLSVISACGSRVSCKTVGRGKSTGFQNFENKNDEWCNLTLFETLFGTAVGKIVLSYLSYVKLKKHNIWTNKGVEWCNMALFETIIWNFREIFKNKDAKGANWRFLKPVIDGFQWGLQIIEPGCRHVTRS